MADVAAGFREAVADVLIGKALAACRDFGVPRLLLGGGVVANARIRELAAERAVAELRSLHHGRELLAALDGHLLRFGARSRLHELAEPRYAERPEFVVESIRLLLERPGPPPASRAERAAERDRLEADVLARVDPADRAGFAALLERVKAAAPLEEGHTLHIDQRGLQAVREALLGFGARLVAEGRLDDSADVFLLDRHELRRALGRDHGRGLQALARRRHKELVVAAAQVPELVVGAPPPQDAAPDPIFEKFYGTPGEQRGDGTHLIGYGASPGRAAGTARVVRSAADLGRVSAGDVLVCTTTTPSWPASTACRRWSGPTSPRRASPRAAA